MMNLFEVSHEISGRLIRTFTRDEHGRRPVYGGAEKFQSDPHWRDHVLFYEYFHGDNGAGLGASHQTGWTGLVAKLIQLYGSIDAKRLLEEGRKAVFAGDAGKAKKADAVWGLSARHLQKINTWVWLCELSRNTERSVNLATVPEQEWDAIAASKTAPIVVHGGM
jgi:hypothetical protein